MLYLDHRNIIGMVVRYISLAKKKFPHLKLVNAQVLQQVLKRLDKAYSDFLKIPERGFPRFRSKNRFRSFVFPQLLKNCLAQRKVKLPSIGWIKIRQSRPYPVGFTPKQFQIVRSASGYYLMIVFQSEEIVSDAIPGKKSLGIDAGISNFIATSNKELIKSPKFLRSKLRKGASIDLGQCTSTNNLESKPPSRKLKTLQRRLKNKIKGSSNWLKLQSKIARFHEKVSNARRDWLFKLAHHLCDQADNIFVEDINYKSWSKGLFRKQSLDSGIGGFINEILPFIAWKRGKFYLKVDKDYSSQECPFCRLHTGKKLLSQRLHECQYCLAKVDRDYASSLILERRGKTAVGQPVGYEMAYEGRGTGVLQFTLFDLVTAQ